MASRTSIFSQAALALGEPPISAISSQASGTTTIFEAAWDQFIPQFIEESRLSCFMTESQLTETRDDGDDIGGNLVSNLVKPTDLGTCFVWPATMLVPLQVQFDEAWYGQESTRWQPSTVNYILNLVLTYERVLAVKTAGSTGVRVQYLRRPVDGNADDEWGDNILPITERAIALKFAEFLAPARAVDSQTIRDIEVKAQRAFFKAKAKVGQVGSRRYFRQSSLITSRYVRGGRGSWYRGGY